MTNQQKPTGLAKIGREIKRPFRKVWREIKRPFKKLISYTLRKYMFEVFREVVGNRQLCKQIVSEEVAKRAVGLHSLAQREGFDEHWKNYFSSISLDELSVRKEVLKRDMDETSREVVESMFKIRWENFLNMDNIILRGHDELFFGLTLPNYKREQDNLNEIFTKYKCPYSSLVSIDGCLPMAYGLKYLPVEVQGAYVSGKDVIDGGGWCGDTSMMFTEFDTRNVYCFEPNPDSFEGIKEVIADNNEILKGRKAKITPVPFALGAEKGSMTLYSSGKFDGSTTSMDRELANTKYEVKVTSIDDFVKEHNVNVGIIKLDIEGGEYGVIKGALNTIKSQRPVLSIAIYHTPRDFFEIKPMLEELNLGYKFMVRHFMLRDGWAEYTLLGYVTSD